MPQISRNQVADWLTYRLSTFFGMGHWKVEISRDLSNGSVTIAMMELNPAARVFVEEHPGLTAGWENYSGMIALSVMTWKLENSVMKSTVTLPPGQYRQMEDDLQAYGGSPDLHRIAEHLRDMWEDSLPKRVRTFRDGYDQKPAAPPLPEKPKRYAKLWMPTASPPPRPSRLRRFLARLNAMIQPQVIDIPDHPLGWYPSTHRWVKPPKE